MTSYIQVMTAVNREEEAAHIAQQLVDQGLAACVQVAGPVKSTYRWKGAIETTEEWQCFIKTEQRHWNSLVELIKEIHPYELPEIISMPIQNGSREYLDWLGEQVKTRNK